MSVPKTKAMKFRRGGRLSSDDCFKLNKVEIEFVAHLPYLGIVFSSSGKSFTRHLHDRIRKGKLAFHSIPDPHKLSIETAVALFELKIEPTACYGVPVIWPYLTETNFMDLDRLKAAFLKRALGVHRSSSNRITYLIATVPLLTEDLQRKFNLPITKAFADHCRHWEVRLTTIDPRVFDTEAFCSDRWKRANFANRHLIAKFAVHGFHHRICTRRDYHKESETCMCSLCGEPCEPYHLLRCKSAVPLGKLT